jgi:cell division initiation protein
MLDPSEILNKKFTVRHVRGYDPQEVDDFLDQILADYTTLLANYRSANTSVTPVATETTPSVAPVVSEVSRILAVAQEAADRQIADAKVAAGKVATDAQIQASDAINAAKAEAQRLTDEAKRAATDIAAAANAERAKVVGELELKRGELQTKVDGLLTAHRETVSKLKDAIQRLGEVAQ